MNAIRAIHPYRHEGLWVFADEAVGLRQEPFVSGADGILDRLAAGIPGGAAVMADVPVFVTLRTAGLWVSWRRRRSAFKC